jgi:hypothetical protein
MVFEISHTTPGDLGTTDESQAERECERQYVEGTNRSLVKIAQTSRIQPTDSVTLARFEINDAQLRAIVAVDDDLGRELWTCNPPFLIE